jgi:hypothetical protein
MNKRKRTPAEKRARKLRKENFMFIFVNGRQKRVRRPPTIDGMPVDEFIAQNADPMWLHQNEMWKLMPFDSEEETPTCSESDDRLMLEPDETDIDTDSESPTEYANVDELGDIPF